MRSCVCCTVLRVEDFGEPAAVRLGHFTLTLARTLMRSSREVARVVFGQRSPGYPLTE
jgi:hypothetical protein